MGCDLELTYTTDASTIAETVGGRQVHVKSEEEIQRFIADTIQDVSLGVTRAESVSPQQRLIDDLGLDSLDYATVLLACEEWLTISVREDDVDWRAIDTVEKLAAFLAQHQGT